MRVGSVAVERQRVGHFPGEQGCPRCGCSIHCRKERVRSVGPLAFVKYENHAISLSSETSFPLSAIILSELFSIK